MWVDGLNFCHDYLHVVVFLVDFSWEVDKTIIILDITQRTTQQKYSRPINLSAHSFVSNILLKHNPVHVLAFVLIRVLKCQNFDKWIEVNRVIQNPWTWFDCLNGILCKFYHHSLPLVAINFKILDYLINHLLDVQVKLLINPHVDTVFQLLDLYLMLFFFLFFNFDVKNACIWYR